MIEIEDGHTMTEYQKDTAFLRGAIRFDDTGECRALEEKIIQVQLDTRCVERAIVLMVLAAALTAAVFAYGMIFGDNFPYGEHRRIVRIIYVIGLTSLLSLGAFSVLWLVYRLRLDRLREDCRRLVRELLECHPRGTDGRNVVQSTTGDASEVDVSLRWVRKTPSRTKVRRP